tara:strand:- start:15652 stop:16755 length:1104 start_codon:yes stop_codon:yes gene_type:complete
MKIPQFMPFIGNEEYRAIGDCFENNWITEGPKAQEFQKKLCETLNVKYGVFAPNGTLALYLGMRALGIGPGDEVIVPDFTFIASANAVEMVGAIPVFADIDVDTLQIDISSCHNLITKKTKAIMPVHIYGSACNMDDVVMFAQKHKIFIIEDAAQALGVKWNQKECGSFGDIACFSFFADKTITTGEGGFVTTNDEQLYNKLRYLRNQGRLNRGSFKHPEIGYNFRMTDIQMALGLTQLSKLDEIISLKKKVYNLYCDLLKNVEQIKLFSPPCQVDPYIPFRVVLLTQHRAEKLMAFLSKNEIETRSFFYPLHLQPCYKKGINFKTNSPLVNSIYAHEHGVCLPSYAALNNLQIEYICDKIKEYYEL